MGIKAAGSPSSQIASSLMHLGESQRPSHPRSEAYLLLKSGGWGKRSVCIYTTLASSSLFLFVPISCAEFIQNKTLRYNGFLLQMKRGSESLNKSFKVLGQKQKLLGGLYCFSSRNPKVFLLLQQSSHEFISSWTAVAKLSQPMSCLCCHISQSW